MFYNHFAGQAMCTLFLVQHQHLCTMSAAQCLAVAVTACHDIVAAARVIAVGRYWTACPACGSWGSGLAYTIRGVAASTCHCMLPRTLTVPLIASQELLELCR